MDLWVASSRSKVYGMYTEMRRRQWRCIKQSKRLQTKLDLFEKHSVPYVASNLGLDNAFINDTNVFCPCRLRQEKVSEYIRHYSVQPLIWLLIIAFKAPSFEISNITVSLGKDSVIKALYGLSQITCVLLATPDPWVRKIMGSLDPTNTTLCCQTLDGRGLIMGKQL